MFIPECSRDETFPCLAMKIEAAFNRRMRRSESSVVCEGAGRNPRHSTQCFPRLLTVLEHSVCRFA